jgi:hypothetical protein
MEVTIPGFEVSSCHHYAYKIQYSFLKYYLSLVMYSFSAFAITMAIIQRQERSVEVVPSTKLTHHKYTYRDDVAITVDCHLVHLICTRYELGSMY